MAKVIFIFEGNSIRVQCLKWDKMKSIYTKFSQKINKDTNSMIYLYNGIQ